MISPAKKSDELIEAINSMVDSGSNDFVVAGIRRDALKMEKDGRFVESRHVLGLLAAFQGDVDEVERCFKAAEAASGNDYQVVVNHAMALSNLRCYRRALEVIDRAVERVPDDTFVLFGAAKMHLDAFDVEGARELIERLHRLGKDCRQEDPMIEMKVLTKTQILEENDVTWREMAERIELAFSVLRSRGFIPMSSPTQETEGDGAMLHEIFLRTDADGAAEAEDAIQQAIANQPYSRVDNAIVFYCLPA